ncbi:MAG: hypothetical protein A2V62_05245 [Nitrospirae bacterium RBG_19FT_COMBO_58_9]|nr:MAG: hypothetical protein A2V62_05245 [Nitrospirae bacterium RBG_19FT_COMBO_58_9]
MHVLSSPIQYMKLRRARRQQKRMALHMLSLSGVLRPGHVELRYAVPLASISAFRTQSSTIQHQVTHPIRRESSEQSVMPTMKQAWQWAQNLSCALVYLAKKPIAFQYSKQVHL